VSGTAEKQAFSAFQAGYPPVFESRFSAGRGLRLIREDGAEFLDGVSGTFNVPLGYDHPKVVDAVIEQLRKCAHMSSSYSAPYARSVLIKLLSVAPPNIGAGWMRDLTGSTANECAIKIAQKSTGKRDVLSLHQSHHGQTVFTTSISGEAFRRAAFPIIPNASSIKVPPPYCYRCPYDSVYPGCGLLCAERIYDAIEYGSSGSVACMIVEPVLGNGGNIVPPPGYFSAVAQIAKNTGMLLIADEVQTGIGRTGQLFACDTLGVKANIITLGKGLGGIGIPTAAVLMESRLDVLEPYEHSFTSGGNMLALAATKATLEVIQENGFLDRVRDRGRFLERQLRPLGELYACVGDVRGLGMMWGLEIVGPGKRPDPDKTNRIIRCAESSQHLILRGSKYGFGNVIKVRPALVATEDDLIEIVERLSRAIQEVEARG
jgi:4-aminobutyrate aminotransferase